MNDIDRTNHHGRGCRRRNDVDEIFAVHCNRQQARNSALHKISRQSSAVRGVRNVNRLLSAQRRLVIKHARSAGNFINRCDGRSASFSAANVAVNRERHDFLHGFGAIRLRNKLNRAVDFFGGKCCCQSQAARFFTWRYSVLEKQR